MEKSLDHKLRAIHADPHGSKEFILADARDADMAFGVGAPGRSPERRDGADRFKSLAQYRQQIRDVIRQQVVDIVLMSASTSEVLCLEERLFDNSPVTPAVRANDATDVHIPRGGSSYLEAARPFRTATLDHAQCGHLDCRSDERGRGVDLGLYSVTFNNRCELDLSTLEQYKQFREEAERHEFRHFLEVFDPNAPQGLTPEQVPGFINDLVARTLAGVTTKGRPLFLKMVYHGPRALEELVAYDPHLVVGVLGGAAGTTRDAFQLIHDVRKYGGRAALFGRKINQAECQLAFIEFLRLVVDGAIDPVEAVRAYHAVLEKLKLKPHRTLEQDLEPSATNASYGTSRTISTSPRPADAKARATARAKQTSADSAPAVDFAKLTSAERLRYHQARLNRLFGER
ncbi:MAG TPA: hypothetical protein VGP63_27755 [Planctomycetaceae bacterium]|jgi:hypothetical protein|nr:hypothetical protein [Planctomycetaceae bacterium]